jgi:hypothetical protein
VEFDATSRGIRDLGKDFQQGTFASAITADNAHGLTLLDVE